MAKGLEVCHKIDFTPTQTHTSSFPFSGSFLPFICSWIYHLSSEQLSVFWALWALGALQEKEEGELSLVGEQLEFLGMAEDVLSSGVKGGQGEVMFYWENERIRPCTDRSSLGLEFTDFRGDLTHPDPC